jgi:hypothetical protein
MQAEMDQMRMQMAAQQAQMEAQRAQMAQQPAPMAPAPVAPAPAASSGSSDRIAQLQQLSELKQSGILTEAEFEAEKAKILASG